MVRFLRRSFWQEHLPAAAIIASATGQQQSVRLDVGVLKHVAAHRQLSTRATEAGGQLFGTVEGDVVSVSVATGPYPGDERSRSRYRSNAKAAQDTIDACASAGLRYLGEWHTHAEDVPGASGLDVDAMDKLVRHSRLNVSAILMLIVGRAQSPEGLSLTSISAAQRIEWRLQVDGASSR
jgi:integrative and conjugative element protein (TIGR02256 family)